MQASNEPDIDRQNCAFEPSVVDPGPSNATLCDDTLEQLPPPPSFRDYVIVLWRSRLPIGSSRAIPRDIESVPHHYWWSNQHGRTCSCYLCNAVFGVGPDREHIG